MNDQHQHIDTASDLRDLIAQTPEETQPARPRVPESYIQLAKDDFAELRLSLLRLRDEIHFAFDSKPEIKNEMIQKADAALEKTAWNTVKYIYR